MYGASVVQWGDRAVFSCKLPTGYLDGGPFELTRLEVLHLVASDKVRLVEPERRRDPLPLVETAGRHTSPPGRPGVAAIERSRPAVDEPAEDFPLVAVELAEPGLDEPELDELELDEPELDEPELDELELDELELDELELDEQSAAGDGEDRVATGRSGATGSSAATQPSASRPMLDPAVERENRRRRMVEEGLSSRFGRDAERVADYRSPTELTATQVGEHVVVSLPLAGDGKAVAVAVRLSGGRPRERPRLSAVAVLEPTAPGPAPGPVELENAPDGIVVRAPADDVPSDREPGRFQIYRGPAADGPFVPEAVFSLTPGAERIDSKVKEGEQACYIVARMQDPDRPANLSAVAAARCMLHRDVFPPEPPESLRAFPSADGILLAWQPSPSPDVRGYRVYRGPSAPDAELSLLVEVVEPSHFDRAVDAGGAYTYRVSAIDDAEPLNESERSLPASEMAP